ncbi:MAG TPA: class A beta-lactamase-related serine hydrolase [Bacteroides sp.]|nr:class A beta-lactamase-related serine hydrolase [Bacteroides sp.]
MRAGTAGLILLGGIIAFSIIFTKGRSQGIPPVNQTIPHDTTSVEKSIIRFDEFLRRNLDSMGTVGAAATIFHGEDIMYTLTYGVRRAGTSDSVNQQTVFRLASVSKGFAGVLLCKLQEEDRLDLNDKVIKYIRDFRLKDSVNTYDLSVRHLLNHTSGLVPHAYDNLAEAGQDIDEILPRLVEVDIAAPPGEVYGYQNVLFSLTDTIARLATGQTYSDLMDENIFGPLQMENASTGFRNLVWNSNVSFPHSRRNGEFYPLPLHTGYYNLLPAAGINASIEDMGKWLKALLGNSPDIIDPEILHLITSPEINTPLRRAYTRHWDAIDGRYYSFGWRIFDYKGYRIIYHGGYVRGYRAEIAFCPELRTGLAFLQNSPNGVASKCVPTFFNMLIEEL